jgi:hypothetical protein
MKDTLNLNICQKLDAVLGLFGYSTVLTKTARR